MPQEFATKKAILIGINGYQHVTPLQFGRADAVEMAGKLRDTLGFERENIFSFVEDSEFLPQRATIFHHLGRIKGAGEIKEDDLLVFFFSGHGMIGKNDSKDYLLPIDATPLNLKQTAIKLEDIVSELQETGCKNIVMFIDACREAVLGERGIASIGEDSAEALKRAGVVTFFSCDPRGKSYEVAELKHGVFTHCILEAIAKGEGNTVSALNSYLRKQVPLTNPKNPQQPYAIIAPVEKGELPIFFSHVFQTRVSANYDQLIETIAVFYNDNELEDDFYVKLVAFLDAIKADGCPNDDLRKLTLIEKFCAGNLDARSFKAAWNAFERVRTPSGGKTNLGKL